MTRMRERRCLHSIGNELVSGHFTWKCSERRTWAQPDRVFNQPPLDLRMQRRHTLIIERHFSTNKHVQHHAEAPHVYLWAGVDLCVKQLRRSKVQRSAERGEVGMRVEEVGETEIDDFDVPGGGDEDVLDFEVCVCIFVSLANT